MVYCGKPSKGCSNCRERKIRCDQREPGCGQCDKRQQKCPGYRNLVDLMFRDESSHVIKKARARARKKANLGSSRPATPSDSEGRLSVTPEPRSRPPTLIVPPTPHASSPAARDAEHPDDSMLMSPESGSWPVTPPMAQLYTLAPTCQENGFAYFFSRYVTAEETASHQKFDFLRDVWKPSSSMADAQIDGVLASMTAVGLMGLASTARTPDLMDAARKSYGTALQLTNHALQDPTEAVKDSTMLSILILGVFEMMAENPSRALTVDAFQRHVEGAVALALMRGPAQFQTRAGRRMFSMLCQRVVVSCAQRNMPMPESLIELWHQMPPTGESGNPSRRLMPLLWQVLQVRSEINTGFLTDPETIVDRLLAIDQQFEDMSAQLPASWKCRTFQVRQHHPAVFDGICHTYSSLHHANVWNHIFTTRILLLETVLSTISQDLCSFSPTLDSSPRFLDEYHRARRKLKHITRNVVAMIPQQLGLMNPADGTLDSADGATAPIATVEIRETPSPPTSPSARSSTSGAVYSPLSATEPRSRPATGGGLTVLDVARARDGEDEAGRYMHLVSATSTVVWPLFVVGMSTACGEGMRGYVVGRLRTLYMETGIMQADAVAHVLEGLEQQQEDEVGGDVTGGWLGGENGQEEGGLGIGGIGEFGLGLLSPLKGEYDLGWVC
ncbi:hypothetical protein C8A05DRAFT_19179 [Staphylotrichum tortipilum]|uniref:Zn(2)-C6 fungal-type domain-containing protein n=1 Tax=Staphylotrichum tortipilum TaxID=2831512 RepID=A0AAN6RPZ3_9PEZI|nr:hypothetical protein C8A05DRAFT_19179 [Staphylotrichum longicolle]